MGFDSASITPTRLTLLDVVKDIMRGAGVSAPSDLTDPNKHEQMATVAVNRALHRIWYAAKWEWRFRFVFLTMEDTVFLYDLPADFIQAGSVVLRPEDTEQFPFINYLDIVQKFPAFAWPDEATLSGEGGTFEAEMTADINNNLDLGGIPTHYTIVGDKMGLFPIPWLANVDSDDFAAKDRILVGYYGAFADLSTATSYLPIAYELFGVHYWLALAYFKQFLQYEDFQADEARGERLLAMMVAKQRQREGARVHSIGVTKQW